MIFPLVCPYLCAGNGLITSPKQGATSGERLAKPDPGLWQRSRLVTVDVAVKIEGSDYFPALNSIAL